ncbi:MAG: phosphate acyltransferase PlsX [Fimbriimonadaceae bacterium]|nr:phosphate acyltransferase PlsX [Fimbriimonadaceae bacterium]
MRIIVDAMGGDRAPEEIVKGTVLAARELSTTFVLVGDPDRIRALLEKPIPANIEIYPASEVIEMDDKPTEAMRKKKDASILVAARLVKEGYGDVLIAAGNTGAATAACLLAWRQIEGVYRPAIASPFPNRHGRFLLLDAGASPDVAPEHLVQFAIMGRAYAREVMGRTSPKVHLLNIGEEPGKGNAFAKEAFGYLKEFDWFAGNIEGKDLFRHPVDVVVCDGFVGNIVLKTAEGVGEFIFDEIKAAVPTGPKKLMFAPLKGALAPLRKKVDYAEYGGSPLLGLNGLCVICHGRSDARAIYNALIVGEAAARNHVVQTIRDRIAQIAPPPKAQEA